jgi:hypothetical protein
MSARSVILMPSPTERDTMYNAPWNTSDLADADVWADFADYAEDIWSDEDDDESEWNILAEDAYLDSYWESLTEM